jgi:triphosphoribosyl-dephospho-CoA synthetase
MNRSVDLLPEYFGELLGLYESHGGRLHLDGSREGSAGSPGAGSAVSPDIERPSTNRAYLDACVAAGVRAERRMFERVGANAHRGYIFVAGLVLMASLEAEGTAARREPGAASRTPPLAWLRQNVRHVAQALLADLGRRPEPSHGAIVRTQHGLGGIYREALYGLPSVFEHGLPALARCRAQFESGATHPAASSPLPRHSPATLQPSAVPQHYAMAILMQVVEDTTAVHRCGPEALERLRTDGRALQTMIERGMGYDDWLRALNADYVRARLTMGGVADCLALTLALDAWRSEPQADDDR